MARRPALLMYVSVSASKMTALIRFLDRCFETDLEFACVRPVDSIFAWHHDKRAAYSFCVNFHRIHTPLSIGYLRLRQRAALLPS